MIDVKEILSDFEEVDIESLESEYGISDEKASISVSLYNKALNKMNVGSYDAARIDLRKSVNMYPNFVEARILLGVCVFALGERTEAVAIFNTVKGANRERALGYIDKLQELSTRPESASFRSAARQPRVPESVNKLDEIMNASAVSPREVHDDFDGDVADGFAGDEETDISVNEVPEEVPVEEVVSEPEEKIVETDMSYVRRTVSENSDFNDSVAPYGGMRRRTERSSVRNTEQSANQRTYSSDESFEKPKEKNVDREALAKANRKISNLTIQKARMTVLAMGIGLCCVILLIAVICLAVSNSNLKADLKDLQNKNPAVDYVPNANGDTSNPSSTVTPDGEQQNPESQRANAVAAYNNAKSLFDEGKYLEAADLLAATDFSVLDAGEKSTVDTLYRSAVNKFSGDYNNKMAGSFTPPENWSAVIEYGLPVYRHNIERENPDFTGNGASICFHLGKAYEMTGDKEKAKEFYNITMNKFPGINYADYARSRLSGLE